MLAKYLIVGQMPSSSAVLFVNANLEDPYKVTILCENTDQYCKAFAVGFRAGRHDVEHRGTISLPKGNPATSFTQRVLNGAAA